MFTETKVTVSHIRERLGARSKTVRDERPWILLAAGRLLGCGDSSARLWSPHDSAVEGKTGRLPPGDPCSRAPGARTQRPLNAFFVWLLAARPDSGVRRES